MVTCAKLASGTGPRLVQPPTHDNRPPPDFLTIPCLNGRTAREAKALSFNVTKR